MIAIILLFLFGFVYGQSGQSGQMPAYEKYHNQKSVNLYNDLYNSDLKFLYNLSRLWVGDKSAIEGKGQYAEKAWMFENTMALLGFLEGVKKKDDVNYDKYRDIFNNVFEKFNKGRLRNWDDASDGVVSEQKLKEYYQAVFLGVLSGIGSGFIAGPDPAIAARYGEVSIPVLGYRTSVQAVRTALFVEYAYRIAYARGELASLYWHAKQQCDTVNNKITNFETNIRTIENTENMPPTIAAGTCCPANLSYLANIRSILGVGFRTLIEQNVESLKLQCIMLLTQLHNAKLNLETLELVLYNLSANYSHLAITEKAMAK